VRFFGIFLAFLLFSSAAASADSTFAGNYMIPEHQSGFMEEQYEAKSVKKLQRGAENFILGPLEVPHGVKTEFARRRSEYLPVGIESFFIGALRGVGNGFKRSFVGLYEMFTFPYPQEPIVEELDAWLY
jgi:putative exosortase-associated protein (TIGR04073 family)